MMILPITLTTAGVSALLSLWLGLRVSLLRRRHGVSVGDGGEAALAARMRAHANFTEYAPFVLILLALVELALGSAVWLWATAILFVFARIAHALGMDRPGANPLRAGGIIVTWLVMVALAAAALAIPYWRAPIKELPSYDSVA